MSAFRPVCAGCGRPVEEKYLQALGKVWHPEHFVCKGCGRPIRGESFTLDDGAPYHAECYNQFVAPRCAHCGKPLLGEFLLHDGKQYHEECYNQFVAPRCAHCGKPLSGQFFVHNGASYHTECYSQFVAQRCAYCGKPLLGEFLVDHWDTKFCKEHQQQYPHCAYCGRLVPPQQQERGVEIVRCPICRSSAVETIEAVKSPYARVILWAKSQGLTYSDLPPRPELCNRAKMAQLLRGRDGSHSLGVTQSTAYTESGRTIRTQVNGIAILHGLPTTLFQGVTMHELGHVWLIMHGIQNLPPWAEEGFCELLAYRYYQHLNSPEARYHASSTEKNPDPVYGDGFRRLRTLCDKYGFSRLLTILDTTKQLPR